MIRLWRVQIKVKARVARVVVEVHVVRVEVTMWSDCSENTGAPSWRGSDGVHSSQPVQRCYW